MPEMNSSDNNTAKAENTPVPPVPPKPPAVPTVPTVQAPAPAAAPARPAPAPTSHRMYSAPYSAPQQPVGSPYGNQGGAYTSISEQFAPAYQAQPADKGFFARLFDMSFTTYITPSFVKLMYILFLIAIWGSWLVYLVFGTVTAGQWSASSGFMAFFAILVVGGLASFILTLVTRSSLEFLVATIKIAENTSRLRELKEEEGE